MKEEKKSDSSSGHDEGCSEDISFKVGNRRDQDNDNQKDITNGDKDHVMPKMEMCPLELYSSVTSSQKNQEDHLKSAKAEIGEAMEENQRLKMYLDRIMKDYSTLQMQFHDIVQQENNKPSGSSITTHQETNQESEFVSLSLGRSSSTDLKKVIIDSSPTNNKNYSKEKAIHHHEEDKCGLALGLDCKFELPKNTNSQNDPILPNPNPETSLEEVKEDGSEETWPPQKGVKTARSVDNEVSHDQNLVKRARVSVRVRCDTPTMNDGCQWRKYGQKIAKANPCPRAYYRCTVAPNCPVRKQVQRCAEDISILITTYEGTHNHPLPISAKAMASTTSAAASMLISGSSSTSSSNINGLNFYLPNSSISSSPSFPFPTITLDLTTNSSASSHLNKLSNNNNNNNNNFPPKYSTTNLSFNSLESNSLPISWSNGVLNYGNLHLNQPYNNNNQINNSLNFGSSRQLPQEIISTLNYQSNLQKDILNSSKLLQSHDQLPPETLAAATKAITNDPSFQSALAMALSTIITSSSTNNSNSTNLGNHQVEKSTTSSFPVLSSFPSSNGNIKCAPSFMNKSPSSTANSQLGNLIIMSPSLPFSSSSGTKSSTSGDNRDHNS